MTQGRRKGKFGAELSERENEVLDLILEGLTNSEIALKLGVEYNTVKAHVRHIQIKRGFNSRMRLIVFELKERMRRRFTDPNLPIGQK